MSDPMKILHIVRHAEASNPKPQSPDSERALTEKGVKSARDVARRLRKAGFVADRMITSSATRALGTARVFAKELKYSLRKIEANQMIYDSAGNASLLLLVQNLPAETSEVLLFGHDPSISDFAKHLIAGFDQSLPKGAVVTVGFETETWADAGPGCARLLRLDSPMSKRERNRRIDTEVQALAASLSSAMGKHLQGIDSRTAEKLRGYVLKHHASKKMRKIAKRFVEWAPRLESGGPTTSKP